MPDINREMMLRVADFLEAHPERHYQKDWIRDFPHDAEYLRPSEILDPASPVRGCTAGLTTALALSEEHLIGRYHVLAPDGRAPHFCQVAQTALGVDDKQASWLFSAVSTPDEIIWALRWLPDHPDATYDDLAVSYGEHRESQREIPA